MTQIRQAVAQWLAGQTGVPAVEGRSPVQEYPLLTVEAEQTGSTLVDGGRQVERRYTVTVTAAADRDREGSAGLLAGLVPALLRGIPMGDRVLHPMEISTEGDRLAFSLCLCQSLPRQQEGQQEGPGLMEHLHLMI